MAGRANARRGHHSEWRELALVFQRYNRHRHGVDERRSMQIGARAVVVTAAGVGGAAVLRQMMACVGHFARHQGGQEQQGGQEPLRREPSSQEVHAEARVAAATPTVKDHARKP